MSFHMTDLFTTGTEVQLKQDTGHICPEGREDNLTARIERFLPDVGDGAVYMDRELRGTRYWNVADLQLTDVSKLSQLLEVVGAMQAWIDAVPADLPLPTMPGYDRDWADSVIQACKAC